MSLSTQQQDELYYLIQDIDLSLIDSIEVWRQATVDERKTGPYLYSSTISGRLLGNSGPTSPFTNTPMGSVSFGDSISQLCLVPPDSDIENSDYLYITSGINGLYKGKFNVMDPAQQTSFAESFALTVQIISTEDDRP